MNNAKILFIWGPEYGDEKAAQVRFNQFIAETALTDYHLIKMAAERPTRNDNKNSRDYGTVTTNPLYDMYERDLYTQITESPANVIVPLGNYALWATTRKWGIEKWRGSQLAAVDALGGRKVIPTYHPTVCLPGRDFYTQFPLKWDLARIKRHSLFPELKVPQRNLILSPTFEQSMQYMEECLAHDEVAYDIETSPRGGTKKQPATWEMICFSLAKSSSDAICIPLFGEHGLYFTEEQHREIMVALARILENPNILKVGQNINYDFYFGMFKHGIECWPIYDTMIAQRLLLPDLPADLGFLVSAYTEEPYYKDDGKQWENVKDWYQFYRYSALDSAVLLDIAPKQMRDLDKKGIRRCYDRTIRTMPACMYMQLRGVRSDETTMLALRERLTAELTEQCAEILALVRERAETFPIKKGKKMGEHRAFDDKFPNSSDQLQAFFYGVCKNAPYHKPRSEGGGVTCDDKALERLARKSEAEGAKVAALVLAYKEKHTLVKNYLNVRLQDGRFFASWKAGNQDSGRTSASKNAFGYGFNLTTLPREGPVKEMVLPDEGYLLVSNDYSSAEARIQAYTARVQAKMEAYEAGRDVYSMTASKIAERLGYKISWEEVFKQDKEKVMAPIAGGKFSWRKIGKESDLGLGYGLGIDKFSRNTGMPLADTKIVHPAWHLVYPEVRQNYQVGMIQGMLNKDRTIHTPTGDRRKFLGPFKEVLESAYSWFCQRTVASMLQGWALAPLMEKQDVYGDVELLLQVHDSVVLQIPLRLGWDTIASVLTELKRDMEQPLEWQGRSFVVPISTSVSGRSLGHMVELGTGVLTPAILEQAYNKSMAV